ncbi:MAG: uroporphyrinogen decarboxylase [Beijerinckiaceae bacterium]|nr:uroporphyrinogen decarboxylase [Beijerinckiaceae bacterium]
MKPRMLQALDGETPDQMPLWLMRQAGRYLSEYRELRAKVPSFLEFCYTPELAVEVTLQPIRRFHFDAAIMFSDILVVPDAFGQKVGFATGEGPQLEPISDRDGLKRIAATIDLDHLAPVFETIRILKRELPADVPLLGFCGAPWTVATYMVAGRGTSDQAPARSMAYGDPELFASIIDRLVEGSTAYLIEQIKAGVDAVQIFESWASVLPGPEFERWSLEPTRRIIAGLRAFKPDVRIMGFPRTASAPAILSTASLGVCAVSLDTAVDMRWASSAVPSSVAVQGNLDPLALIAGGEALTRGVAEIKAATAGRPAIFNLGHGIQQHTPVAHVEKLVELVRS